MFNQAKTFSYLSNETRPSVSRAVNKVEHERAFRPAQPGKKGRMATLDKFPEYTPNPVKGITRVRPVEGEDQPARWKSPTNSYSKPVQSIATNMRNMKASFPTVFRR